MQKVDWVGPRGGYHEDVDALYQAFLTAKEHTEAPSFIALRTIIGWPAPNKQNTGAAHGSALGVPEVKATKEILHFDPEVDFPVEEDALNHARQVAERGKQVHAEWEGPFAEWAKANPEAQGAVRPDGRPPPAGRLDRGAAGVPGRRQGHGHPQGVRHDPHRAGARSCPSCGAARLTWPRAT